MLTVLLVEDDKDLADTVTRNLEFEGINCHYATNGRAGYKLACEEHYQVLLLDLNLPGMDGLHLCQKLREKGDDTPILMLTARGELDDKLGGFNAGTDDYLVKPFALEELVARIQTLARRRSGEIKKLSYAGLVMDLRTKTVTRDTIPLKITPTGWQLLEALLRVAPDVVPRHELETAVWGDDIPDSNSLKVHISNLRKVIDSPFHGPLLHTVGRHGFAIKESAGS